MSSNPVPRFRNLRPPRLPAGVWVVLALVAGAAPWAGLAIMVIWPGLLS